VALATFVAPTGLRPVGSTNWEATGFSGTATYEMPGNGRNGQLLSGALEKLTEEQRLVVISKFGEGLSNAQTAAWLGKTEGAIEALQHRALRTLCRLLGSKEPRHKAG
jgi:DNA-directed RNA polymerase specialized sigma24 family protein